MVNAVAGNVPMSIRKRIYRSFGIYTDSESIYGKCVFTDGNAPVRIGKGTLLNQRCLFTRADDIVIGENCAIAFEVMFLTVSHRMGGSFKRAEENVTGKIQVGNGCWIGARAIILPGVHIKDGCVIAAGAVVTKDCEPNGLYAGVPARRIKDLSTIAAEEVAVTLT